jgi:hypothetical protein
MGVIQTPRELHDDSQVAANGYLKEVAGGSRGRLAWHAHRRQDNNHDYTPEQAAYDSGLLDQFLQLLGPSGGGCRPDFVMGCVDGDTVTAVWNYAQHFGLSDNHFGSIFGPWMPGAINLTSGQTAGAIPPNVNSPSGSPWGANGTMIGNPPAAFDDCAEETGTLDDRQVHQRTPERRRHDLGMVLGRIHAN